MSVALVAPALPCYKSWITASMFNDKFCGSTIMVCLCVCVCVALMEATTVRCLGVDVEDVCLALPARFPFDAFGLPDVEV